MPRMRRGVRVGVAARATTGSRTELSSEGSGGQVPRRGRLRPAPRLDRGVRVAAAGGIGWLVLRAGMTAVTGNRPEGRLLLGDVVDLVPVALAAVLGLLVTTRVTGRRRRMWSIVAV